MDSEKDFLKRDLGNAESKEEIEKLIDDAETMGHDDIVEMAKEKLAAILVQAKAAETTPPAQVSQVESMGGSVDEVAKRTEDVDAEIDAVKKEAAEKIAEVKGGTASEEKPSKEKIITNEEKATELKTESSLEKVETIKVSELKPGDIIINVSEQMIDQTGTPVVGPFTFAGFNSSLDKEKSPKVYDGKVYLRMIKKGYLYPFVQTLNPGDQIKVERKN